MTTYGPAVDVWSVGVVMFVLYVPSLRRYHLRIKAVLTGRRLVTVARLGGYLPFESMDGSEQEVRCRSLGASVCEGRNL